MHAPRRQERRQRVHDPATAAAPSRLGPRRGNGTVAYSLSFSGVRLLPSGRCARARTPPLKHGYAGRLEHRPVLGTGRPPEPGDIARAVRLCRGVTAGAAAVAGVLAFIEVPPGGA